MSTGIDTATVKLVATITDEIYDISLRPIGYGGYSDIYTAVWRSRNGERKVAIKVIRTAPRISTFSEMPRALRHEISVWKRISHPNIHELCGVYEGFGPAPALVSPWYENGDINEYVRKRGTDPDIELVKLKLFAGVATGLKFLHDRQIVHGDLKGGNVLISDDGVPRVCDFGLSRLLLEHSVSTTTTGGKGTVRWMAPELLIDDARHSYASDVWACGCLIIEVWSSVRPYHTKANDQQVILALSRRERPDRPADMPDMLWPIVEACCSVELALRPSPLHLLGSISCCLTMQKVDPMVTLNRPVDTAGSDFLKQVEVILHAADPRHTSGLYTLPDAELVTEVVRLLATFSLASAELSPLLQNTVFVWCLAKLGPGSLRLPSGVSIPNVNGDKFVSKFNGPHELANIRAFARLVDRARPGLGMDLMTQFAIYAQLNIDAISWSVAWFPDGNRIVVGCSDTTIHILDLVTGATLHRLVGHTDDVRQVSVSPDGMLLASCSDDGSIRLWDAEMGLDIVGPMIGHTHRVRSVVFSPDGRHIASGSSDMTIRVWSTKTCTTVLGPLLGHTKSVLSVAYSPDGSRIVSGSSDHTIRVWNARTGDPILTLSGHTGLVRSVTYSPDGLRIVSGSYDFTVRIWDATTGQQVGSPLKEHSDFVLSVAYSPDSWCIVSSSDDHTSRIWDAATGAPFATIRGHKAWVSSVAFSPDAKRLASASGDGTIRISDATDEYMRWDI